MAGRSHLSIGEVLSLLQDEFPDVTISKIRFLESQGLVDPERTPSGYRKFYEEDIERLRWVLRQQRDAFLPLKVIRGRLEGQESLPLGDVVAGDGQERPVAAGVGEGVGEPARERAGALLASNAQGPAGRGRKVAVGPIEVGPIGAGQTEAVLEEHQFDSPGPAGPKPAGPSTGGPSTGGPSTGGPSTGGPSTGGPSTGGPGAGGALSLGGGTGEASTGEAGTGEASTREASTGEASTGEAGQVRSGAAGAGRAEAVLAQAGHETSNEGTEERRPPAPRAGSGPKAPGANGQAANGQTANGQSANGPRARGLGGEPAGGRDGERASAPGGPSPRPPGGARAIAGEPEPEPPGERPQASRRRRRPSTGLPASPFGGADDDDDEQFSLEELLGAAGVGTETVQDLERYGLIAPKVVAGVPYYTRDDAVVARLAAAFARHGVEARHLRAYKGAAEREAGVVQQVVMPLIRQRNPEARRAASLAVEELSSLGAELRAVLLREALSELR